MKISAVCFDLGQVLLGFDLEKCYQRLALQSAASAEQIRAEVVSEAMHDFERGSISEDDFFSEIAARIGFRGEKREFAAAFDDIFWALEDNIRVAALLAERLPAAIISNTNPSHIRFAESHYDFFSLFSVRIYSHEHGLRKPEREIYERALEQLGIPAAESLFIDDLERNIDGALAVGMNAIHLPPGSSLRRALQSGPDWAAALL